MLEKILEKFPHSKTYSYVIRIEGILSLEICIWDYLNYFCLGLSWTADYKKEINFTSKSMG